MVIALKGWGWRWLCTHVGAKSSPPFLKCLAMLCKISEWVTFNFFRDTPRLRFAFWARVPLYVILSMAEEKGEGATKGWGWLRQVREAPFFKLQNESASLCCSMALWPLDCCVAIPELFHSVQVGDHNSTSTVKSVLAGVDARNQLDCNSATCHTWTVQMPSAYAGTCTLSYKQPKSAGATLFHCFPINIEGRSMPVTAIVVASRTKH